ncbi:Wadjet anti-phage system protein JetD domain-containing protein [Bacteroides sp.]|uniref:Wadjet anti-phage system protein JetD domain-containing protein n=1 Tax=Bacteroides sp. TaxID=29523 RepID=UPI0026254090|nr:Wadjet anti-phage system protein JetD domain-containing protein [Bacteroides sp.]MDD3040648.1 DUF2220 family protein [Bacteroides sp.]
MKKSKYVRTLLTLMLKKYESSKGFKNGSTARRPQFALENSPLAGDYYDETSYEKREAINQALIDLSKQGIIEVKWNRFRPNDLAEKVYLNTGMIQKAYEIAGIKPRVDKIAKMMEVLSSLQEHPWLWVREWYGEVSASMQNRKTGGLILDDPEGYEDLVAVLNELPLVSEGTTIRVFSQKLFGDSKRFERTTEKRLLALLKRYGEEYNNTEEYLDSIGLVRNPKTVLMAGDAVIAINGTVVELSTIPEGLGLTLSAIKQTEILKITGDVLLVENLTSYYDLMNRVNTLIIYIGGFPHKGTQELLIKVKDYLALNQCRIAHTGDMDYGGIRIFEYLTQYFPDLEPYLMDLHTYEANLDLGSPFGSEYAKQLDKLLERPEYEKWYSLIKAMLGNGLRIEQEAIILRQESVR